MLGGPFQQDSVTNNIDQFILLIQTQLEPRYIEDAQNCDTADKLLHHVYDTKELFHEVMAKLRVSSVESCTVAWFTSLLYLCQVLLETKYAMDRVLSEAPALDPELVRKIRQQVGQLYGDMKEAQIFMFSKPLAYKELLGFLGKSVKFTKVVNEFYDILVVLVEQDVAIDLGLINTNPVKFGHLGTFTKKLFKLSVINSKVYSNQIPTTFSALLKFIRLTYMCGCSDLFMDTLYNDKVVTPDLPLELMEKFQVNILDVICYYKYTAFNLLCVSLRALDSINETYNQEAGMYFKCYFLIPSSDYSVSVPQKIQPSLHRTQRVQKTSPINMNQDKEVSDSWHTPLLERQEVSLLYILNTICASKGLEDLSNQPKLFRDELNRVVSSLPPFLSSHISNDTLSSRGSRSGLSGWDAAQTGLGNPEQIQEEYVETLKFQSFGSVLINGTYKEKLVSVLEFLQLLRSLDVDKIVQRFSLNPNSRSQFNHLYELTEPSKYPGTNFYYKCLDLITKLLRLFKLKFIVKSVGSSTMSESTIRSIIGDFSDLDSILRIKNVLDYSVEQTGEGNTYYFTVPKALIGSKQEAITRQLKLAQGLQALESN